MKIILFDIDGTLLRTGGVGAEAVNRAFRELFGIQDAWNNYDPNGKTDYEIIQNLAKLMLYRELKDSEQIEIAERYVRYFRDTIHLAVNFRVLPGVQELLTELSNRHYFVGLATGNLRQTADIKLKHGKIDHFFSFGGFGCDSVSRLELTRCALKRGLEHAKWKVKPEEVVLIGDARQDMECGRALGLRTIGVATGGLSFNQLSALKPALVLEDLTNLKQIFSFINR